MKNFAAVTLTMMSMFCLAANKAEAGVIELSASASYRNTNYDPTHSDALESGTGSIGYYFWDLSALEISYTRGAGDQQQPEYEAYQDLTAYGMDLLMTIANKESSVKPYVKIGAAYSIKDLRYFVEGFPPITVSTSGLAPTAGIGFKIMLSQQLAIKAGVDVSTSPLFMYQKKSNDPTGSTVVSDNNNDPITYDFSASAGISFLF